MSYDLSPVESLFSKAQKINAAEDVEEREHLDAGSGNVK
jgi:hypothetical protein